MKRTHFPVNLHPLRSHSSLSYFWSLDPTAKMTSKIISREILPRGQNWSLITSERLPSVARSSSKPSEEDTCMRTRVTCMKTREWLSTCREDRYLFFIDILYFCVFNVRLNDYSSIYCNYFSTKSGWFMEYHLLHKGNSLIISIMSYSLFFLLHSKLYNSFHKKQRIFQCTAW